MIQLIDQSDPGRLKYRCTDCEAEFTSTASRLYLHKCDGDEETPAPKRSRPKKPAAAT